MLEALGDFWMDYGEIIVLVSAAVTLIGVVFTLFRNNSISDSTVDKVESKGNQLSSEHGALSAELRVQSGEQRNLLDKVSDTKSEIKEMRKTVSDVNIRLIQSDAENKARFINLDDAQKKLCSSAEDMGKFAAEFSRLVSENMQLLDENRKLTSEKNDLLYRLEKNREIIRNYNQQAEQNRESDFDELEI